MFEFFDDLTPENEERISDKRADKIKASVLSRIEEDKPVKKHFSIKPLIIAAAITATGAASVVTANAATDGAIANGIANTFSFVMGGNEYTGTFTAYENSDGTVTSLDLHIPDDMVFDEAVGFIVSGDDDCGDVTVTPIEGGDSPITIYFNKDLFTSVEGTPKQAGET